MVLPPRSRQPPAQQQTSLAGLFLTGYLGLAAPIIGLGIIVRLTGPIAALTVFGLGIIAIAAGTLTALVRLTRTASAA